MVVHLSSNSVVLKFKNEVFLFCNCVGRNKYCTFSVSIASGKNTAYSVGVHNAVVLYV